MHSKSERMAFAACLLFVTTFTTIAQGMTRREYFRHLESVPTDAVVEYCLRNAPETKAQIDAGLANYTKSLNTALQMWVAGNPTLEPALSAEVSPAEVKSFKASAVQLANRITAGIQRYDPHKYCNWLAPKLEATTPQDVLQLLHQYEDRVKAGLRDQGS